MTCTEKSHDLGLHQIADMDFNEQQNVFSLFLLFPDVFRTYIDTRYGQYVDLSNRGDVIKIVEFWFSKLTLA